ncbi:MAG: hypothetical protein WCI74_14915 [Actinomycetes bacterium]
MRRTVVGSTLAVIALSGSVALTSACGSGSSTTPTPSASATASSVPTPSATSTAASDVHKMDGVPFQTKGGGTLSVSAPTPVTPTAATSGSLNGYNTFAATITFINGAPGNPNGEFKPDNQFLSATSGEAQCVRYVDPTGNPTYQNPTAPVPAGGTVSWQFAFSCPAVAGSPVTVKASRSGNSNAYYFVGTLPQSNSPQM